MKADDEIKDEERKDFRCFVCTAFVLQQFMQSYGGASVGGFFNDVDGSIEKKIEEIVLLLVLLAVLTGWKKIFCFALFCRWWLRWRYLPYMWESEVWTTMHEINLVLYALGFFSWRKAVATIQWQTLIFYAAAAAWKFNTSFLDHRTSCGSIFIAQILTIMGIPIHKYISLWNIAIVSAPIASAVVETLIPILLWFVPGQGLLFALLFHLLIVFCEPPNNAGGFSVSALRWLYFFAERGSVSEALTIYFSFSRISFFITILTLILVSAAIKAATHPFFFDTAVPIYCLLFPTLCLAALKSISINNKRSNIFPITQTFVLGVVLALLYGFGLPVAGVIDQMSPNMFANQRFHGGSNHIIFPTGVLHQYLPKDLWSVIRVRNIDPYIPTHPAEVTTALPPAVRAVLSRAGHSGRQFNPGLAKVIGPQAIPPPPGNLPQASFTLVAWEFRRLLDTIPTPYSITFALLDGLTGDEVWRRGLNAHDVTITKLSQNDTAICSEPNAPACRLAVLPPPPKILTKLAAFAPLPIFLNEDESSKEVYCFGP